MNAHLGFGILGFDLIRLIGGWIAREYINGCF